MNKIIVGRVGKKQEWEKLGKWKHGCQKNKDLSMLWAWLDKIK